MEHFWKGTTDIALAQGDLLLSCLVPQLEPDYGTGGPDGTQEVSSDDADLIVVTQSCDLKNDKVALVALCPIHTLEDFEAANPKFRQKGQWETVRKGRVDGLHMGLPSNIPPFK